MTTVVSQHVCHLVCHLGFFKKYILRKTAVVENSFLQHQIGKQLRLEPKRRN